MNKYYIYITITVLIVTILTVFGVNCSTFSQRNHSFESQIEEFYEKKAPGSEFLLFNEEDLSGWMVHGLGKWTIQNGVLNVKNGMGYLSTQYAEFDDFILTLKAKTNHKGNSGIFFRAKPPTGFRPWPVGYEAQIDHHDPKNLTGSLYNRVKADRLLAKDGEWFDMEIRAIGPSIRIQVNGETIVDATDTTFTKGFIALQAHDPFSVIQFKDIRIRIPEAP